MGQTAEVDPNVRSVEKVLSRSIALTSERVSSGVHVPLIVAIDLSLDDLNSPLDRRRDTLAYR